MTQENTDQTHNEQQPEPQLTMEWSDWKPAALFTALMKAQGEFPTIKAGDYNPHFKNKYTSYNDIVEAIVPVLVHHGLAFFHQLDEHNVLYTYVVHGESGQWMRCSMQLKPTKDDEQGRGSSISYCKRYSLTALLGLATSDNDDDGNAASRKQNGSHINGQYKKQQRPASFSVAGTAKEKAEASQCISPYQVAELRNMCADDEVILNKLLEKCQLQALNDMPAAWFNRSKEWVSEQVKQKIV